MNYNMTSSRKRNVNCIWKNEQILKSNNIFIYENKIMKNKNELKSKNEFKYGYDTTL